jgi:hypothetical protein
MGSRKEEKAALKRSKKESSSSKSSSKKKGTSSSTNNEARRDVWEIEKLEFQYLEGLNEVKWKVHRVNAERNLKALSTRSREYEV